MKFLQFSIRGSICRALRQSFFKFPLTLLTAAGLLMVPKGSLAAGTWTALAHKAPGGVGLMLLLSDGTVMCQSGVTWYRLTPDIYGSYVNGTWTTLAPMHDSRTYYSSQVLRDGRVFVAGGEYGTGKTKAEIYNTLSNTWTQAATPPDTVIDNISAMMPNGDVLEGFPGQDCRSYDPNADAWSAKINILDGQDEAEWVKLQDGSIITIDPFGTNTERYVPALNQWVRDNPVPVTMYGYGGELGPGFLLPNGKVIFFGGTSYTSIYTPWTTNSAGIYSPTGATNAGAWVAGPNIPNSNAGVDAPAAMMINGKILCCMSDTNNSYGNGAYYYEYDYVANSFAQVNAPTGGLHASPVAYAQQMLDLPDGTVLISGFGSQVYSYKPSGSQIINGVPTVLSVTTNLDGSFHLTGTLFNGISDGAAYGDDKQMSTAYPIARMTNSSGNVLYCRTYNWNTNVVMTGTNIVTTEMTLPAGLLAGTYPLFVTANGFSSAPYPLAISGTPLPPVTGLVFTLIASNQMAFHWNDIGLTETGYVIERSTDGTNYSTLAVLGGNTTNYADTTVTPLGQYYYQVLGTNSVGLGLAAPVILAASPAVTALPAPWQAQDVGPVLGAGASGTNAGAFTVIGSGNGISTDNDQFQFVYQPVIGDVTITARVVSNQNTGSNAMAGVMIRSSLGLDVADALIVFDGGAQSSIFEHRETAAALATYGLKVYGESYQNDAQLPPAPPGGPSGSPTVVSQPASAPLWVRLVRSGNTFTSYTSTNGTDWAAQGTNTVVMPPAVEVGLAVTSGAFDQLNTSTFDNVTVSGTPAAVPPAVAEWKLDETSGTVAKDSVDSFDGLYNNVTLGLPGATPATGYSGGFDGSTSYISVPALNLNSNVMTVTAWINPSGSQSAWSGIFFNRANSTVAGLHFGTANELRYTWNNSPSTYNQSSGLVPPPGVWSFVALVIEPTRARIYMATNGGVLVGWTNNVANPVQAFDGASDMGQDPAGGRFFNGQLDEVQFYNQALTPVQLGQMVSQPVVTLTAPDNGLITQAYTSVSLGASLTATNGHTVNAVAYFADDGELLGESTTAPYAATNMSLSPGTYSIFARLFYDSGYSVDSELNAVQVTVQPLVTNSWDAAGSLTGPQDGSGNWGGSTANWWNGSAAVSWTDFNYAVFGAGTTTNCTVTLTNDVTPYAITFNAGTGSYMLAGTNNIWLGIPRTPLTITANGNATISATLLGDNSLVKAGNGTITLTASNNYTGNTIVTAGILKLGTNAPLGAGVIVSNTGAVDLNGRDFTTSMFGEPFTLGGTGLSVLTNSSGTRGLVQDVQLASNCTIAGGNTIFIGGTNAVNGTLNLNGYTLTKAGSGTLLLNGLNLTGAGNITVNAGTLQLMDTYGNDQEDTTLSGSGNLTINAGGSVMTYKWGSTLAVTMPVVMNGGTLGSGWPGPNGATYTCPIVVNTNSTFNFNGGYDDCTFSGDITGNAGLTLTGGSLTRTFTGTNGYGWTVINAGVLKIGNAGTSGTLGFGPVTNNANLTFSRSDTLVVSNAIAGTGVLNQSGTGTLVLAARNLYTGTTTVNSGTLLVNGSISTNTVTVLTNATLGGVGTINGSVMITNTAILAPGTNSPGILAISGKLVLAANSTNKFRLNKGGVSDEVSGSSGVIYGGTLLVTNVGSSALAAGDSFRLFGAATYSGTFARMTLPALNTNLAWDTSKLAVSGTLSVAALVVITNQPQNVVADAGQNVGFMVGVSGSSPLTYQWYFNGTNLAGATLSTLTLNNVQLTNAGNYTVVIANAFNAATSSVASLTVYVPPVISAQPQVTGGGVQFGFSGPNGQTYQVLGSTNLASPATNWMVLTNGTFGAGPAVFTDANPTNASYFYRVTSP